MQPDGVVDGAEQLGSLGGTIVANDLMEVTLGEFDGLDYNFAELGNGLTSGDTANIAFWQNRNGKKLIEAGGTALADWLTDNFGNIFGDEFEGADGKDVAKFYKKELFKQKSKKNSGPAKVDAQFMATALAVFFTSSDLAGNVAARYGFNVTAAGIGGSIFNVGAAGAAFEVADNADVSIMQLLLATNGLTDRPDRRNGFASIYDINGDGKIDSNERNLRTLANRVYKSINTFGPNGGSDGGSDGGCD